MEREGAATTTTTYMLAGGSLPSVVESWGSTGYPHQYVELNMPIDFTIQPSATTSGEKIFTYPGIVQSENKENIPPHQRPTYIHINEGSGSGGKLIQNQTSGHIAYATYCSLMNEGLAFPCMVHPQPITPCLLPTISQVLEGTRGCSKYTTEDMKKALTLGLNGMMQPSESRARFNIPESTYRTKLRQCKQYLGLIPSPPSYTHSTL